MSKRTADSHEDPSSEERSVRAKADQAAAAADAQDLLDSLYDDAPTTSAAAVQQAAAAAKPPAAAADATDALDALYDDLPSKPLQPPASVALSVADAADDILDALYATDEAQLSAAAAAGSSHTPGTPVVATAAAGGNQPPQLAAAAVPKTAHQQPSSPTNSAGGGSSSRSPPTFVGAADIPADLDVFNNAVLLMDKPKGWTSFDVCNAIKKGMQKLGVKKVGHAGTLDPAATGLLIVCTGAGTKSIESFMAAHKEYSGTLKLGEGTPTLDAEGEVDERLPWEHITDDQIKEAAQKLTGDIEQVPPMFSALHHEGQRLHELARAGVIVERQARPVTITRFDVHRDENDRQLVHFYVGCSKGTYIRTLGHDLATSLGTTGHLVALRREAIGEARVGNAWHVETFIDKLFAAIREQRPEAFNKDQGNRHQGNKRGRGRGGRRGGIQQQQQQQQDGQADDVTHHTSDSQ